MGIAQTTVPHIALPHFAVRRWTVLLVLRHMPSHEPDAPFLAVGAAGGGAGAAAIDSAATAAASRRKAGTVIRGISMPPSPRVIWKAKMAFPRQFMAGVFFNSY